MDNNNYTLEIIHVVALNGSVGSETKMIWIDMVSFRAYLERNNYHSFGIYWVGDKPRAMLRCNATGERFIRTPPWRKIQQEDKL